MSEIKSPQVTQLVKGEARLPGIKNVRQPETSIGRGGNKVSVTSAELKAIHIDEKANELAKRFLLTGEGTRSVDKATLQEIKALASEARKEIKEIHANIKSGHLELARSALGLAENASQKEVSEALQAKINGIYKNLQKNEEIYTGLKSGFRGKAGAIVEKKIQNSQQASERGVLNYVLKQRYQTEIGNIESQYHEQLKTIANYSGTPKERLQQVLESGILPADQEKALRLRLAAGFQNDDGAPRFPGNQFVEKYGENLKKAWGAEDKQPEEPAPNAAGAVAATKAAEINTARDVKTPSEQAIIRRNKQIEEVEDSLYSEQDKDNPTKIAARLLRNNLRSIRYRPERDAECLADFIQAGTLEKQLEALTNSIADGSLNRSSWRTEFQQVLKNKSDALRKRPDALSSQQETIKPVLAAVREQFKFNPDRYRETAHKVNTKAELALASPEVRIQLNAKVHSHIDKLKAVQRKLDADSSYDTVNRSFRHPTGERMLKDGILTQEDLELLDQNQDTWLGKIDISFDVDSPMTESNSWSSSTSEYYAAQKTRERFQRLNTDMGLGLNPDDLSSPLRIGMQVTLNTPPERTYSHGDRNRYVEETQAIRAKLNTALAKARDWEHITGDTINAEWSRYINRHFQGLMPEPNLQKAYEQALKEHPGNTIIAQKLADSADQLQIDLRQAQTQAELDERSFIQAIGARAGINTLLSYDRDDRFYLDEVMKDQFRLAGEQYKTGIMRLPVETQLAAVGFNNLPEGEGQIFADNIKTLADFVHENAPRIKKETLRHNLDLTVRILKPSGDQLTPQPPDTGVFAILDIQQSEALKYYPENNVRTRLARRIKGNLVILTDDHGTALPTPVEADTQELKADGKVLYLPLTDTSARRFLNRNSFRRSA